VARLAQTGPTDGPGWPTTIVSRPKRGVVGPPRLIRISPPSLVESAVDAIRQSILDSDFKPGERLNEARLASELGISRGPIREAMHVLAQEGLVESTPRRGRFVQSFDDRTIDEVYSLRKVLEIFAVERIVVLGPDNAASILTEALDAIRASAEAGDARLQAKLDIAFHGALYELANHRLLLKAWHEDIAGKLQILLNATIRTHADLEEPVRKHEVIVRAIEARDLERARLEVSLHLEDARRRALASFKRSKRAPRRVRDSSHS
jgi:DNA-binding GntR family transcriptional regulator